MKQNKFEKVIEWEKKPNYDKLFGGIGMVILSFFNAYVFFNSEYPLPEITAMFSGFFLFFTGIEMVVDSIGKDRKVYWKNISQNNKKNERK